MSGPGRWVLLAYQVPREPSTPRVSVWRKLRRLGVAQLIDGLVALPFSARNRERLEWLAEEIREANGEATIWVGELRLGCGRPAQQVPPVRGAGYRPAATGSRVYRRMSAVVCSGSSEPTARRRTLARLRRYLQLVRERDYFPSQAREQAIEAVERLSGLVGEVVP